MLVYRHFLGVGSPERVVAEAQCVRETVRVDNDDTGYITIHCQRSKTPLHCTCFQLISLLRIPLEQVKVNRITEARKIVELKKLEILGHSKEDS